MIKVLAFGGGQLGSELAHLAKSSQEVEVVVYDYPEGDITDFNKVAVLANQENPDFIVNAAAYTAVDKAESDEAAAFAVNAIGPENLAKLSRDLDIPLIHVSTDYVFSGEANSPYLIDDAVNPQSAYGRSKLAGEWAVEKTWHKHVIIRTAWVYSAFGANFVKTMLRLAAERDELGIVADQKGTPTNARDLAAAILTVCQSITSSPSEASYGLFHYTNEGECTWYDFAVEIFSKSNELGNCKIPKTKKLTTADYPTPAKRPSYSVLDLKDIKREYSLEIPSWQSSLEKALKEIV